MEREIKKKMVILKNRLPFDVQVKKYIDEIEQVDWVYSNLRLDGSSLSREMVNGMVKGDMVLQGRIADHILAQRLEDVREYLYRQLSLHRGIEMSLLLDTARILGDSKDKCTSNSEEFMRKSTPQLIEYDYTPPLPMEIGGRLEKLMLFAGHKKSFANPFNDAAYIHNELLAIWPFKQNNEFIARAICQYRLMLEGFPVSPTDISESEYHQIMVRYFKTHNNQELASILTKETYKRLELMIQLTAF